MELISRQSALAAGLTKYFTGRPCVRGHISMRYCSNKKCIECDSRQRQFPQAISCLDCGHMFLRKRSCRFICNDCRVIRNRNAVRSRGARPRESYILYSQLTPTTKQLKTPKKQRDWSRATYLRWKKKTPLRERQRLAREENAKRAAYRRAYWQKRREIHLAMLQILKGANHVDAQ